MQAIRFVVAILLWILPAAAQAAQTDVRAYIFGNSLINHASDAPHTNVPHWLNVLAQADGRAFAVDGQFGFSRNFEHSLPPAGNWSFPGVARALPPGRTEFRDAAFTDVVLNPANFIQHQAPDAERVGDTPGGTSAVAATLRTLDRVRAQGAPARFHIYEGWADMGAMIRAFPPSDAELAGYHGFNRGAYHDWYVDYLDALRSARPELDLRLIPVASTLSDWLGREPLNAIPAEALYSDDTPHGTETLYFLAALVTYSGLYGVAPPVDFAVPDKLHPLVVEHYARLRAEVPVPDLPPRTREAPDPAQPTRAAAAHPSAPSPAADPALLTGAGDDGLPALGMGLNGVSDWSTQLPFIDLMKSAREWVGHLPGQWGGVTAAQMRAGGHLDENGWPLSIPPEVERIEAVLLNEQPREDAHLRGAYRMFYDGQADFRLVGRAKRVAYDPGEVRFFYDPGEGHVGISISALDPQDPIRNIRVVREDLLPLHRAGVLFNPDWIARIEDLRSIRFMDWMSTNGSPLSSWDSRPRMTDYTWTSFGVPLEVMVALANQIGADPWFTLPHLADDDFVRRFATHVRDTLDPRLRVYAEYSNEVWNFTFAQASWAAAQAEARWGPSDSGWMQYYALRAAQFMGIWTDVFGPQAEDRLIRVMSTHTGWPGLEENILIAPLAMLELGRQPRDSFDAYAVTGYFGYELGGDEMAADLQRWLDASEQAAREAGVAQGLQRVALREYVKARRFEAAYAPVTKALLEGSLRALVQEVLPYHAEVARENGMDLVMYEGGTHVVGHGPRVDDQRLTEFFTRYNYSPEMAGLYEVLLTGWVQAGGTLFNAFVDVAPATRWGSWGALRHLGDSNPRWDILMAYNRTGPSDWAPRDPGAFANGRIAQGTGRIEGTPEEDILLGAETDDVFLSGGGSDHLNGGAGTDLARLRGSAGDYSFRREGDLLIAEGRFGRVHLYDIEQIAFDTPADLRLRASDL